VKIVYKYVIEEDGEAVCVDIPKGGQILKAGFIGHKHVIWALVDPEITRYYERVIFIAYTGQVLPEEHTWTYINTYTSDGLVYHAFEAL
jgi:hypothetical protein